MNVSEGNLNNLYNYMDRKISEKHQLNNMLVRSALSSYFLNSLPDEAGKIDMTTVNLFSENIHDTVNSDLGHERLNKL